MTSIIDRLFRRRKEATGSRRVTITSVNLKFMGNSHGLDGMEVTTPVFDMRIPFQNKMGNNLLPDNLKGPKMVISSVSVGAPFRLVSIEPGLPVEVPYMSRTVFTLKIAAPEMTWEGPLSINFGNEPANSVTVSIRKVTLHHEGKSVELEESGVTTSMQKSQLFRQNLQLYKAISYGDTINMIEVNKPFEIVSTDPKLPIKADRKDSYIISLYMKCPEFSYAGDLDIKLS